MGDNVLSVRSSLIQRSIPLFVLLLLSVAFLIFGRKISYPFLHPEQIVAAMAFMSLALNAVFALVSERMRVRVGSVKAFGVVAFAYSWGIVFVLLTLSYALSAMVLSLSS